MSDDQTGGERSIPRWIVDRDGFLNLIDPASKEWMRLVKHTVGETLASWLLENQPQVKQAKVMAIRRAPTEGDQWLAVKAIFAEVAEADYRSKQAAQWATTWSVNTESDDSGWVEYRDGMHAYVTLIFREDQDPALAAYLVNAQPRLHPHVLETLLSHSAGERAAWLRTLYRDELAPLAEIAPDPIGRGPSDRRWNVYPSNHDKGQLWIYYAPIDPDLFMVPVYSPYHVAGVPFHQVTKLSRVLMNDPIELTTEAESKMLELDPGISRFAFLCGYLCVEMRDPNPDRQLWFIDALAGGLFYQQRNEQIEPVYFLNADNENLARFLVAEQPTLTEDEAELLLSCAPGDGRDIWLSDLFKRDADRWKARQTPPDAAEATSGPQDKPEADQRVPVGWQFGIHENEPCAVYIDAYDGHYPAFPITADPLLADYLFKSGMIFLLNETENTFKNLSFTQDRRLRYVRRWLGIPDDQPMRSTEYQQRIDLLSEAAQDAPEWTQSNDGYMLWRNTFTFHASNDIALARWLLENQPDSSWLDALRPPFDVDGLIGDIRVRLGWPRNQSNPSHFWGMDERGMLRYTYGGESVAVPADDQQPTTVAILVAQPFISLHNLRMLRGIASHNERAQAIVSLLSDVLRDAIMREYEGLDIDINTGYKKAPAPRRRLAVSFSYDAEAADITAALFKLVAGMADRVSISTVTFDED